MKKYNLREVLKETATPLLFLGLATLALLENDSHSLHIMTAAGLICCYIGDVKRDIIKEIKKNN